MEYRPFWSGLQCSQHKLECVCEEELSVWVCVCCGGGKATYLMEPKGLDGALETQGHEEWNSKI